MIISIWRYSHFSLAVSSSLFLLIATLTGVVLAFEPIENQLSNDYSTDLHAITIDETIQNLNKNHHEIISIEVQKNDAIVASFINEEGNLEEAFVNPNTGEVLGYPVSRAFVYQFSTSLHRSLFLKKTGRFFVGLTSFLLFLISLSGFILVLKRQGGFKKIFSKIIDQKLYQYLHVVFGRLAIVPIMIVTLTGVYLSLEKFNLLPSFQNNTSKKEIIAKEKANKDDRFFNVTTLAEVKHIEFPFSTDEEDFYTVYLLKSEVEVNQVTGFVESQIEYPFTKIASYYSLILHTGQGSFWWSLVLLLTSVSILYFMYSGFKISIKRRKKSKRTVNKYSKDNAEYIILYGSENGTTFSYAKEFYKALLGDHKTVFLDQLNNVSIYKNAQNLIIFAATYGEGNAPSNAKHFLSIINKLKLTSNFKYAVVGFGSKEYPDYCQFAIDIYQVLQKREGFVENIPLHKISNQSYESFSEWLSLWNRNNNLELTVKNPIAATKNKNIEMSIVYRTEKNIDNTYLLQLECSKKIKFKSGDLLGITPEDQRVRYYSISKYNKHILLSIKKHELGVVSNFLYESYINSSLSTNLQTTDFHFPKKAKDVILIGNGTGIAPFIGMLDEIKKKQSVHMFLGMRTKVSLDLYEPYLKESKLESISIAYSQEEENLYVQDVLASKEKFLKSMLEKKSVILICGSIQMGKSVLQVLDTILLENFNNDTSHLLESGHIKMDCY
jgi:sulfite reductase (NADPH) flavoprotein alpha-component